MVCLQAPNYIAAVLLALSTMLQLELPHVNILSKVDLLWQYGQPGTIIESENQTGKNRDCQSWQSRTFQFDFPMQLFIYNRF